ncbi:alpha/beta hydrolase [Limisphaera sp. VF-2]|uniref:alpha/beta hydrolase n=1 Tax=Limisphaera sp. VF-2 TaxID=3400418 RepID=UPI003C250B55
MLRWLLLLVLLWGMLRWFEHRQIYFPTRTLEASGRELGRPVEELELRTPDGLRLHGWYFPADPHSPRASWAMLVCHGNGGNISHRLDLAGALLQTGAAVLLFDYRGYGRSEGRPSETGTYRDARAAYEWLRGRGHPPGHIVAVGESLGGAIAAHLATEVPVGGLILLGAFTSIPDIGSELYPWLPVRWLARTRYDTRAHLRQIQVPVLILHSREDSLVRYHHAEANFAAAPGRKWLRELRGDHNESLTDTERITAAVEEFLRNLEADLQGTSPTP